MRATITVAKRERLRRALKTHNTAMRTENKKWQADAATRLARAKHEYELASGDCAFWA